MKITAIVEIEAENASIHLSAQEVAEILVENIRSSFEDRAGNLEAEIVSTKAIIIKVEE